MSEWHPDPHLIGNGAWCSGCFPKGPPRRFDWRSKIRKGCNECAGAGRIVFSAQEIIAASIGTNAERRERAS